MGEQSVLLGLVEAVDLVHEEDRALAVEPLLLGRLRDDLAQLGHTAEHRAEQDEARLRLVGHDVGEGRLARTGRPPEDHGREAIGTDGAAEHAVGTEQVGLAHDVCEGPRAHAVGQGRLALGRALEQVHRTHG